MHSTCLKLHCFRQLKILPAKCDSRPKFITSFLSPFRIRTNGVHYCIQGFRPAFEGMQHHLSCNTFTSVNPSSGREMSEIVCSRCYTMLVFNRGATNIRCPNCSMVNSTRSGAGANQMGHLQCGHCRTTLAYPPGASTVGCPTCRHVNPVRNNNTGGSARGAPSDARPQTVLVENPKTLDDKGKLVSNVVVGVTSWKR